MLGGDPPAGDDTTFLAALNSRQQTFAGVDYTVNSSRYDEVVVPFTSQALPTDGPAA